MFMDEKYIRTLIRLVEESNIDSLEVSRWGRRIKISGKGAAKSNGHSDSSVVMQTQTTVPPPSPAPTPGPAPPEASAANPEIAAGLVEIKSPMVGTFYKSPAPDADPYVSLNEKITVGQVVCIVEAMKLMNEIESEVSGRVVKILVENAKPVEFGQVLFLVDPKG
jgi:acetyl-CoA carboxylase biotin carboxyl carrier protein